MIAFDISERHQNACNDLKDSECPIVKDELVIHELAIPMKAPISQINTVLEFIYTDENQNVIMCFGWRVHISD